MLSALDWSLIATWQEAGFPLQAVLAGIDATFEKYESRKARGRARRINGLAYCAQEVLRAVEDMHEAATGAARKPQPAAGESGFESARIAEYLRHVAEMLHAATVPENMRPLVKQTGDSLIELADRAGSGSGHGEAAPSLSVETLEQRLLVLEDQLYAALQTFSSPQMLLALREQSARELAPYRSRLETTQIRQIEQQFLRRTLFQQNNLPRLSLFYMSQV